MVLVLTELVQNAIEHAFPDDRGGTVSVAAERDRSELRVIIRDDGVGIPDDFDAAKTDRLGLQIVNTLVSAELEGAVQFRRVGIDGGTTATVAMPISRVRAG